MANPPPAPPRPSPADQRMTRIEHRVARVERMMHDSLSRLDRVQHLVELLLNEAQAQRLDRAGAPDGATRWSPAGFPVLPRNAPVHFGSDRTDGPGDPDAYLASGWFARESWGVWGRDAIQTLRFALEDWRGGYASVNLALQCFVPPGGPQPQVDITANGYFLGVFHPGTMPAMAKLRLPPSCIGDGDILLQLTHDAPLSPSARGQAADDRILGVGLVTLDAA